MVLESFEIGMGLGVPTADSVPPYVGDYSPAAAHFYTDLDLVYASQGQYS